MEVINHGKALFVEKPLCLSESELESDKVQNRTVRSECSSCGKMFEVDLPEGVDRARTACPHCGSIESIALQ